MSTERIKPPKGASIKTGQMTAELQWKSGFAQQKNAQFDRIQKFVDSEVLRLCDQYTPMRTGMLIRSGTLGTVIGSGTAQWIAPYARAQYYSPRSPGSITGPLRGPQWFERMKADRGKGIISGAKKLAGGG